MEKNTTQVGSFSDPMLSELYGNIRSVSNPEETVVGYVGVYTTESKTFFILNSELPLVPVQPNCLVVGKIHLVDKQTVEALIDNYIPIDTELDEGGQVLLTMMEKPCLDCRVYGSSVKPDFW
jgi:hypothetical protein